jgi:hypothetical protein
MPNPTPTTPNIRQTNARTFMPLANDLFELLLDNEFIKAPIATIADAMQAKVTKARAAIKFLQLLVPVEQSILAHADWPIIVAQARHRPIVISIPPFEYLALKMKSKFVYIFDHTCKKLLFIEHSLSLIEYLTN